MKRVLFVLLCAAAIVAIPACKQMSCKKEGTEPMIPTTEQTAPVATPEAAVPAVTTPAPVPAK